MRCFMFMIVILTGCVSLSRFEKSMVYQPVKTEVPPADPKKRQPGEFEDVRICVEQGYKNSGDKLHGLYAEAENPRGVILFFHGNGGNVENCVETVRLFQVVMHMTVLVYDYRGYGLSDGVELTEEAMYQDARKVRAWLADRAKVKEQDIILYGYSLGGAVAVELASKDGARGLILDRTFTSIADVAQSKVLLPVGWLMESKYDSLSKIKNYKGPLLQMHGNYDHVVPYRLGRKLHDAANDPKTMVLMRNGRHNDPLDAQSIASMRQFLDQLNSKQ